MLLRHIMKSLILYRCLEQQYVIIASELHAVFLGLLHVLLEEYMIVLNASVFLRHVMVPSFLCHLVCCQWGFKPPKFPHEKKRAGLWLHSSGVLWEQRGRPAGREGGKAASTGRRRARRWGKGHGQRGKGEQREGKPGRRNSFVQREEQRGWGEDGSGVPFSLEEIQYSYPLPVCSHEGIT